MKLKKYVTISVLMVALGVVSGCHYKSSDNDNYRYGTNTYRDGYGTYRDGYREGRAAERRREAWRDSRDEDRRDAWRRRW